MSEFIREEVKSVCDRVCVSMVDGVCVVCGVCVCIYLSMYVYDVRFCYYYRNRYRCNKISLSPSLSFSFVINQLLFF